MAGISYLSNSFGNILFIFNQQKKSFWAYFGGAILNISLNALLIPRYGLYGAAIASVLTAILTCLLLFFFIKKYTSFKALDFFSLKYLLIILLSTVLMGIVLIKLGNYNVNPFLRIFIGGLVYFIGCFLLISMVYNKTKQSQYKRLNKNKISITI